MSRKRIFITGGTGFFGKSLIRHCRNLMENEIIILSRDPEKRIKQMPDLGRNHRIEFLKGDIRDFKFPEGDVDYILHGATTSGTIIPDDEMQSVVVDGTRHMLEFARRNSRLSNLLYISSGAVYGNQYHTPMHEELHCEPVNVYGRSKYEAEHLCRESGIPFSIARCFSFVGEYLPLDAHFAIGNFIRDCLSGCPIIIKGDGLPVRTYMYSGDLACWLWTILLNGKNQRTYNVGSDQAVSIAELAAITRKAAGTHNDIRILTPSGSNRPHCYAPDISRACLELGLDVETPLEKAIVLTLEYHKQTYKRHC